MVQPIHQLDGRGEKRSNLHGHGVIPAWAMPRAALGLTCLRVPRSIGSQKQLSSVSSLGQCSQEETEVQSGDSTHGSSPPPPLIIC